MTKKIFVSRHRLTECPACLAHIQIAEDWARTQCPFCGASLATVTRREKVDLFETLRALQSTTGGLMAASLIGLGLVACEADTGLLEPNPAPVDTGIANTAADSGAARDTGFADTSVSDVGLADAVEPPPGPEYGGPPVMPDATVEDAMEPPPVADYGIAPIDKDGGVNMDAEVEDAAEPPVVALYGISPVDASG